MRQRISISAQSALLNAGQLAAVFVAVWLLSVDTVLGVVGFITATALIMLQQYSLRCPKCWWSVYLRKVKPDSIRFFYTWPPAQCPNCGVSTLPVTGTTAMKGNR
jgi:hypothetical protein